MFMASTGSTALLRRRRRAFSVPNRESNSQNSGAFMSGPGTPGLARERRAVRINSLRGDGDVNLERPAAMLRNVRSRPTPYY